MCTFFQNENCLRCKVKAKVNKHKLINTLINLYLHVHKILTVTSIAARVGGTLIDVFLTLKARESHLTITPGRENHHYWHFCLRWKIEILCFLQAQTNVNPFYNTSLIWTLHHFLNSKACISVWPNLKLNRVKNDLFGTRNNLTQFQKANSSM